MRVVGAGIVVVPAAGEARRQSGAGNQGMDQVARFVWREDPGVIVFEAEDGEELSPEIAIACGTLMHAHALDSIERMMVMTDRSLRDRPLSAAKQAS